VDFQSSLIAFKFIWYEKASSKFKVIVALIFAIFLISFFFRDFNFQKKLESLEGLESEFEEFQSKIEEIFQRIHKSDDKFKLKLEKMIESTNGQLEEIRQESQQVSDKTLDILKEEAKPKELFRQPNNFLERNSSPKEVSENSK
jgi:septal ring factor EnvC (AmiA/AmiB activator)